MIEIAGGIVLAIFVLIGLQYLFAGVWTAHTLYSIHKEIKTEKEQSRLDARAAAQAKKPLEKLS